MDADTRKQHLEILRNPTMPSPSVSFDTGQLARDLPPRRSLRERLQALVQRAPTKA